MENKRDIYRIFTLNVIVIRLLITPQNIIENDLFRINKYQSSTECKSASESAKTTHEPLPRAPKVLAMGDNRIALLHSSLRRAGR